MDTGRARRPYNLFQRSWSLPCSHPERQYCTISRRIYSSRAILLAREKPVMPTVGTSITDVTVYTDRARVSRRGSAHLAQGEQTLAIENVPTSMQDDSVRASGRGA